MRDALKAMIVANEFLESEARELWQAVSHAYVNRQISHALSIASLSAGAAMVAKFGGMSIPTGVRGKQALLGRGTERLSEMFLAPDSVGQIRAIAARAAETPMTDAMLRQIIQTPNEISRDW